MERITYTNGADIIIERGIDRLFIVIHRPKEPAMDGNRYWEARVTVDFEYTFWSEPMRYPINAFKSVMAFLRRHELLSGLSRP